MFSANLNAVFEYLYLRQMESLVCLFFPSLSKNKKHLVTGESKFSLNPIKTNS
jgi:hypothetical protein